MIVALKAATGTQAGLDYRWVAVMDGGNLYTSDSTTASSWTSRTSSFSTTDIQGVASNGANLYVAVGSAGKLATSPDGINWTQRTSSFGTDIIYGVAYGNNVWVAVGAAGKLATSTDGITWTQRTSATGNALHTVAYGASRWGAAGDSGVIVSTGSDPTTGWTSRTSTLTENQGLIGYSTLGTIWVAAGDTGTTGALASSTDTITWTARTSASSLVVPTFPGGFDNNDSAMVLGRQTVLQSSTNGTSWTARTSAYATYIFRGIASDNLGTLVAIMEDGLNTDAYAQSSTDGSTWTTRGLIFNNANPRGICHSAGKPSIR